MVGFTESLNISVSAAILMNRLSSRLRASEFDWALPVTERTTVLLDWATNTIKRPELIIDDFLAHHPKK
jgi:tRNA (guanosine-2'-O-)-methyltransferase